MIPILYESIEKDFTTNGLGRLADCLSCVVSEVRNGIYECKFTYPITGAMYSKITIGRIICVTHDDAQDVQPFDIYKRSAPINGIVTFYAHHISYRLGNIIVKPFSASTCAAALAGLKTNTYTTNPFTFWTDKLVTADWTNALPASCKALLGGSQGSILDIYGKGEYEFDKWTVKLHVNRGDDNGVSIRYGVNLVDLVQDLDDSSSYTGIAPYWTSEEATVRLPEGYVMRRNISIGSFPWTTNTDAQMQSSGGADFTFSVGKAVIIPVDLSSYFDTKPTVAQLRQKAQNLLNNSDAWLPSENIKISFIDLSKTKEYQNIAALQSVRLCDHVNVYCSPLNVNAVSMQVIRTDYNVLLDRYDKIELGTASTSFADTVSSRIQTDISRDYATKSALQESVSRSTDLITGAKDSHVRFMYDANGGMQEILIMDTDSINTAVNVWRWNKGGLGFSSNGYGGPYGTAITQDGAIVADFITAGIINADLIKSGTINADLIQAGAINANLIKTGTINADLIGAGAINANLIKTGTINADLIGAGRIKSDYIDSTNLHVKAANIDGELVIGQLPEDVATTSDIPENVSELNNDSGYQNSTQVTTIANGVISTAQLNANQITSGKLSADYIQGGTLTLGGSANTNGVMSVKNASGNEVVALNNAGIAVNAGEINLRSGSNGFSVSQNGHIAIGVKPSDMSSFANNTCAFQATNTGEVKVNEIHFYGPPESGANYINGGLMKFMPALDDAGLEPRVTGGIFIYNADQVQRMIIGPDGIETYGQLNNNDHPVATVLASGTYNGGNIAAGGRGNASISFGSVGTSNYIVILNPVLGDFSCGVQDQSNTSFRLYYRNNDTAGRLCQIKWAIINLG